MQKIPTCNTRAQHFHWPIFRVGGTSTPLGWWSHTDHWEDWWMPYISLQYMMISGDIWPVCCRSFLFFIIRNFGRICSSAEEFWMREAIYIWKPTLITQPISEWPFVRSMPLPLTQYSHLSIGRDSRKSLCHLCRWDPYRLQFGFCRCNRDYSLCLWTKPGDDYSTFLKKWSLC